MIGMRTKQTKFEVVAIHFTGDCNLHCSFCYQKKKEQLVVPGQKDLSFFLGLPLYLKEITRQVALGGGEPFLYPYTFVRPFSKECSRYRIICNVTTNGTYFQKLFQENLVEELREVLKYITMVSISFDKEKVRNKEDIDNYFKVVDWIKRIAEVKVVCNLLVDEEMFDEKNRFFYLVEELLAHVDSVYALCSKLIKYPPILERKAEYLLLTKLHPEKFFVDDLTYKIISEKSYDNWKTPCHYGSKIVSIDKYGRVFGCSFDDKEEDKIIQLEYPGDVLCLKPGITPDGVELKKRYSCPYLVKEVVV